MNGTMSDEAKIELVNARVGDHPIQDSLIGLSTKSTPPTHASTLAEYEATEISVSGYARQAPAPFGSAFLTADFHARAIGATITFNNTSGAPTPLIHSWFWFNPGSGQLIMAGLFDAPFVLAALIGTYSTAPFWQLTGE